MSLENLTWENFDAYSIQWGPLHTSSEKLPSEEYQIQFADNTRVSQCDSYYQLTHADGAILQINPATEEIFYNQEDQFSEIKGAHHRSVQKWEAQTKIVKDNDTFFCEGPNPKGIYTRGHYEVTASVATFATQLFHHLRALHSAGKTSTVLAVKIEGYQTQFFNDEETKEAVTHPLPLAMLDKKIVKRLIQFIRKNEIGIEKLSSSEPGLQKYLFTFT